MPARSKEDGLNSCSIYGKKRSRREAKREKLRKKRRKKRRAGPTKSSHLLNIKNRGRDQNPELCTKKTADGRMRRKMHRPSNKL